MTQDLSKMTISVLHGQALTKEEALKLCEAPLDALRHAADQIRQECCGNGFDLCSILNGKSGHCSEDCKFCAQSCHCCAPDTQSYPLLGSEQIVPQAIYNDQRGVSRFSIVTSGRTLSETELKRVCKIYETLNQETSLSLCASHGLLAGDQLRRLRDAGVTRYHCNLETSKRYFPSVCSTHTYEDKIQTLTLARRAGLTLCSGGIIGMGETMEDRIDLALKLRALGVRSIPLNMLSPIPVTPFEALPKLSYEEIQRTAAIFRFLLPDSAIRLAGGRGALPDKGRALIQSGLNAAITGDMLTTAGIRIRDDLEMLSELGMEAVRQ